MRVEAFVAWGVTSVIGDDLEVLAINKEPGEVIIVVTNKKRPIMTHIYIENVNPDQFIELKACLDQRACFDDVDFSEEDWEKLVLSINNLLERE